MTKPIAEFVAVGARGLSVRAIALNLSIAALLSAPFSSVLAQEKFSRHVDKDGNIALPDVPAKGTDWVYTQAYPTLNKP